MPQTISGVRDDVINAYVAELGNIVQDTALLMPAASLNGNILLKSEIEDMFTDNSLFRLYGCGNTDAYQGYGLGSADQTDTFADDPGGLIGNLNVNNCLYNNYGFENHLGVKGMKETWPKDSFTLASFNDDGDVDSAEYWGALLLEQDKNQFHYWLYFGKICDFHLANGVWRAQRTGWRAWLRGLWQDIAGVQLPQSASDVQGYQNVQTRMFTPFAVVHPKQRFVW